jgi:hypothetical protein
MYEGTCKCESINNLRMIGAIRMFISEDFSTNSLSRRMHFLQHQPASEGGGKVDGDERSRDPLPGVLEAVLVQALARQPLFDFTQ